jgi:hypothetical protein
VELFEVISKADATKGKEYWSLVKDVVLAKKRFDIAKIYIQDFEAEFKKVKAVYDRNLTLYDDPRMGGERFRDYNEGRFVGDVKQLVELCLALESREAAVSIRDQAKKILDDPRLQITIP